MTELQLSRLMGATNNIEQTLIKIKIYMFEGRYPEQVLAERTLHREPTKLITLINNSVKTEAA